MTGSSLDPLKEGARWFRGPAWSRAHSPQLAALAAVVIVVGAIAIVRPWIPAAGAWIRAMGYPAVFFIGLLGSASILVPIPSIIAVCTGGVLLTPAVVGMVAAVGETTGELTGYLAGFGGRAMVSRGPMYQRLERQAQRRGWIPLFLLAVIPNPVFDVAGISAGVFRYPVWRFFGVVLAGKLIKSLYVAYGCAAGWALLRGFQGQ